MSLAAAIKYALAARDDVKRNHISAALRRALLPAIPSASLPPSLAKALKDTPPAQVEGIRRALGITVATRGVTPTNKPLGACFASLDCAAALQALTTLDQAGATRVLHGLITRAGEANYFALADLLSKWDAGSPPERLEHRSRVLTDYLTWRN